MGIWWLGLGCECTQYALPSLVLTTTQIQQESRAVDCFFHNIKFLVSIWGLSSTITLYPCYMKNCDPFFPAQNFVFKFWVVNLNFQNKDLALLSSELYMYLMEKVLGRMSCYCPTNALLQHIFLWLCDITFIMVRA